MMHPTAVIIGAGHAGLAMSRRLTERSIDHVVLERGAVANSWRTQRWPSLRLLTPNWLTRLPGYDYAGNDPDGYLPAAGVVATLTRYAHLAAAPVRTATTVHTMRTTPGGFEIQANDDMLHARAVVLAPGRAPGQRSQPSPAPSPGRSRRSPRSPTTIPASSPTAACSSSERQPPASSSPARSTGPGAQ